jgi:hypothetical protein
MVGFIKSGSEHSGLVKGKLAILVDVLCSEISLRVRPT